MSERSTSELRLAPLVARHYAGVLIVRFDAAVDQWYNRLSGAWAGRYSRYDIRAEGALPPRITVIASV